MVLVNFVKLTLHQTLKVVNHNANVSSMGEKMPLHQQDQKLSFSTNFFFKFNPEDQAH